VVMSACPLRPLRARPRRLKRRARSAWLQPQLRALNGPVPYQVRKTLERPEPPAQTKLNLEGCNYRPVASKPVQTGATGALDLRSLLISGSRAGTAENPRNTQMRKDGNTQVLPRTTLLIRGSKPDPRRVRTGAPDHQSQGRRGRAHSSLSSSPTARARPTCRVRESARAASRGDPTEGELPRPRSLASGTEPHLANPRKRFNG
jgi:hypothetical protein